MIPLFFGTKVPSSCSTLISLSSGQSFSTWSESSKESFPCSTNCIQAIPTTIFVQDAIQKILSSVMGSELPYPRFPPEYANFSLPSFPTTTIVVPGRPFSWSAQAASIFCWSVLTVEAENVPIVDEERKNRNGFFQKRLFLFKNIFGDGRERWDFLYDFRHLPLSSTHDVESSHRPRERTLFWKQIAPIASDNHQGRSCGLLSNSRDIRMDFGPHTSPTPHYSAKYVVFSPMLLVFQE